MQSNVWTAELKAAVNYVAEPGTFWIGWQDFLKHFREVTVSGKNDYCFRKQHLDTYEIHFLFYIILHASDT